MKLNYIFPSDFWDEIYFLQQVLSLNLFFTLIAKSFQTRKYFSLNIIIKKLTKSVAALRLYCSSVELSSVIISFFIFSNVPNITHGHNWDSVNYTFSIHCSAFFICPKELKQFLSTFFVYNFVRTYSFWKKMT